MQKVEKSIEVRCPLQAVYGQWTRFEDFPAFMSSVMEVRKIDETRVHCHAKIQGERTELDAEIIDQLPNEYIAWKSLSGTPTAGVVHFEPLGPELTRVRLMMAYEPAGPADCSHEALESLGARIQDTVEGFKSFIESRAR
jgi:uncharacterized membrane protein